MAFSSNKLSPCSPFKNCRVLDTPLHIKLIYRSQTTEHLIEENKSLDWKIIFNFNLLEKKQTTQQQQQQKKKKKA